MAETGNNSAILGWREWLTLPALHINKIKAKVDTGARTSALHTLSVTVAAHNPGKVSFIINPSQYNASKLISCEADIVDLRWVTDSGGHREQRYVICTPVVINQQIWSIEITLAERDNMRFRMLLGRSAINGRFIVDPARSFLQRNNAKQK